MKKILTHNHKTVEHNYIEKETEIRKRVPVKYCEPRHLIGQ